MPETEFMTVAEIAAILKVTQQSIQGLSPLGRPRMTRTLGRVQTTD
jgi:hypothetical protein